MTTAYTSSEEGLDTGIYSRPPLDNDKNADYGDADAFNQTYYDDFDVGRNFFDVYYSMPRFAVETTLAMLAIFANLFVTGLLLKGSLKQKGTAYRILFYNLSAANSLCCLLTWMANNTLLIFQRHFVHVLDEPEGLCRVFLCLMAAMFVSVAFGTESCITMLGFTAVQYRSVSRPLVQWAMARQKMAYVFLATSWIFTFLFGCIPLGMLLTMSSAMECTSDMHNRAISIVIAGATMALSIEAVIYVIVIVLSSLIYVKLRRYGQSFWNIRFDSQIRNQKRTFGTTLMLFITLVLFSLPYMVLYVVTLDEDNISQVRDTSFIHYMNLLPYFKFLTDPIIYGFRMREVKESWFKILVKCGLQRCACSRDEFETPRSPPPYLLHHITFV